MPQLGVRGDIYTDHQQWDSTGWSFIPSSRGLPRRRGQRPVFQPRQPLVGLDRREQPSSTSGIWNSITSCHHRAAHHVQDTHSSERPARFHRPRRTDRPVGRLGGSAECRVSECPASSEAAGHYTMHIGLSPDGRCLAVSTVSGHGLSLWDTENGKLLLTLPEEAGVVWAIAWSPDASHLRHQPIEWNDCGVGTCEAPANGRVGSGSSRTALIGLDFAGKRPTIRRSGHGSIAGFAPRP